MTFPNRSNYIPFVVTCVDEMAALSSQGPAILQSVPSKDECQTPVKDSRKRLLEDPVFQGNESNESLVDTTAMLDQPDTVHAWNKKRVLQLEHNSHNPLQQPQLTTDGRIAYQLPSLTTSLSQVSPYAMELAARTMMPKKRTRLSTLSKTLMNDWFEHHLHHPYPTEEEKKALAVEGGIALEQVNNWFINTRGRKWKPMINRLMAEKQAGTCPLLDKMTKKIKEPYHMK
ncbi:hypothetical protein JG687_00000845 [Phytophthora cactorum]|uniref:Homeobox domain-containing protein n=1 Tax=Phytophthora cactorum TaxID=29920 RepID=A0A329T1V4_9STRA|nr:hypothetical protein Pcac1_g8690 [Phytophthora cactorum]KAG2834435.1 hypothetical protein PC112_g6071 [Phytophthora cactorum]KAG2836909.1 hypothetical protein PC111_g4828 [Phytophthora cactorum]KAG2862546.1 hypothetical protein PC113_g6209 [Phytophthora cactorum]KAG2919820.1 hypothetical protein PC114_g6312 [Phytophthora cactorum]